MGVRTAVVKNPGEVFALRSRWRKRPRVKYMTAQGRLPISGSPAALSSTWGRPGRKCG